MLCAWIWNQHIRMNSNSSLLHGRNLIKIVQWGKTKWANAVEWTDLRTGIAASTRVTSWCSARWRPVAPGGRLVAQSSLSRGVVHPATITYDIFRNSVESTQLDPIHILMQSDMWGPSVNRNLCVAFIAEGYDKIIPEELSRQNVLTSPLEIYDIFSSNSINFVRCKWLAWRIIKSSKFDE